MAETIGEQLRAAREERGVPLREVSDQTRISIHYLEAIELNDYARLPGGIFNRSFVKAYARYVGYDEKKAVEAYTRYMRDQGDSGEEVASTPFHSKVYTDTPATRSPVLTVALAIVILALLTAGALALLKWYQRRSAELRHAPYSQVATTNRVLRSDDIRKYDHPGRAARVGTPVVADSLPTIDVWKADYEPSLQQ
ncbi:MAG: helix-turn-helix domain-containing protein [Acidobacteriota bacterium]|nr:helix-turn-helix domain-containing protein [Acidobacteriota bacterium]